MMGKAFVRLGNWGHRHPSTFVRRSALIIAVAGMLAGYLLWWTVATPLLIVVYPIICAVKALVEAVCEIPGLTVRQADSDWEDWSRNWPGICRVWSSRKAPDHA